MTDLLITWSPTALTGDLSISGGDLETHEGLESAILLSLFTDLGAWWGDPTFGSKLFRWARSKREPAVLAGVVNDVKEALTWLVEDRVALSVDATAEFVPGGFGLAVVVTRPTNDVATFRFNRTWFAQEARS